jgi:predicted MFS family arabinose efflux permease
VSGVIADVAGWRAVFAFAAAITAALALVLRRELPAEQGRRDHQLSRGAYTAMLRSTVALAREHAELRRSAVLGALGFASFSVFWTTVAFRLADAPFGYSDAAIGLLGLAGAAGALCASVAGRLADRGRARLGRLGVAGLITVSFPLLWWGRSSIVLIIIGVVVLDLGVQGLQVLNQTVIYELAPGARSRTNSVYMTTYFVGGALGSASGAFTYDRGGWGATCALGTALGAAAIVVASLPMLEPEGALS